MLSRIRLEDQMTSYATSCLQETSEPGKASSYARKTCRSLFAIDTSSSSDKFHFPCELEENIEHMVFPQCANRPCSSQFAKTFTFPNPNSHLCASTWGSASKVTPLVVVLFFGSCCSTCRSPACGGAASEKGGHAGDRASLWVFGFEERTKESWVVVI
jgi:hypothetical protein